MSEEFKNKLKDYMEGRLSQNEREYMEQELQKLEEYQSFLDEQMRGEGQAQKDNSSISSSYDKNKESKILRRGKWKARIHNALTALLIIIIIMILGSAITSAFYGVGKVTRMEIYRDVVRSTIAVTQPNLMVRGAGIEMKPFLSMEINADIYKKVGKSDIKAGEMDVIFLLAQAGYPNRRWIVEQDSKPMFLFPVPEKGVMNSDWERLEKLPEGTVTEAYISLENLHETGEILRKFEDREMTPLWFAVDTGFEGSDPESMGYVDYPIGFPFSPIWHSDDWTVTDTNVERSGISGKVVTETKEAPRIDTYGSEELRNENFIKTLTLLQKYNKIADRIAYGPGLELSKRLEYINSNGVRIYGVVVTGPSKEILKLKDEPWVEGVQVGEVELWNWN